jgi:hypothetical protein
MTVPFVCAKETKTTTTTTSIRLTFFLVQSLCHIEEAQRVDVSAKTIFVGLNFRYLSWQH